MKPGEELVFLPPVTFTAEPSACKPGLPGRNVDLNMRRQVSGWGEQGFSRLLLTYADWIGANSVKEVRLLAVVKGLLRFRGHVGVRHGQLVCCPRQDCTVPSRLYAPTCMPTSGSELLAGCVRGVRGLASPGGHIVVGRRISSTSARQFSPFCGWIGDSLLQMSDNKPWRKDFIDKTTPFLTVSGWMGAFY